MEFSPHNRASRPLRIHPLHASLYIICTDINVVIKCFVIQIKLNFTAKLLIKMKKKKNVLHQILFESYNMV